MTTLLKKTPASTLIRHGAVALSGGLAGALGEWAGLPGQVTAALVVVVATLGATAAFFRPAE